MSLDGRFTQAKRVGDIVVFLAFGKQADDLPVLITEDPVFPEVWHVRLLRNGPLEIILVKPQFAAMHRKDRFTKHLDVQAGRDNTVNPVVESQAGYLTVIQSQIETNVFRFWESVFNTFCFSLGVEQDNIRVGDRGRILVGQDIAWQGFRKNPFQTIAEYAVADV